MDKDKIKTIFGTSYTPLDSLISCLQELKEKNFIRMTLKSYKPSLKIMVTGGAGFIGMR